MNRLRHPFRLLADVASPSRHGRDGPLAGRARRPRRGGPAEPVRRGLRRGDRGTIALYTVLLTPTVLLLAGLLVDGGLAIHARQRAADMAEQAARAGANEIDADVLRATGEPRIDTGAACASAYDLLDAYGQEVTERDCLPGADEVRVTVTIRVRAQLLAVVPGLGHFTMTSTASAHPETGETP